MNRETDEIYIVGEVDFSSVIIDEAIRMNLQGNLSKCQIKVKGMEGTIPHFHLTSNSPSHVRGSKETFECCICIFEPLYFNHEGKRDKLSSDQARLLNDWMKEIITIPTGEKITNWASLVLAWKMANGDEYIPKNPKQPDYTTLRNMRN